MRNSEFVIRNWGGAARGEVMALTGDSAGVRGETAGEMTG